MSDDLTRYMVPEGGGIEPHPAGLLYHKADVDAYIDAINAENKRHAARIEALTAERDALAEKLADAAQILSQCTWTTMYVRGQYVDRNEVVESYRATLAAIKEGGE